MFTGIVESMGSVASIEMDGDKARLVLEPTAIGEGVVPGDSIAVNGACLTVCGLEGGRLAFEAVRETLDKTNLGGLEPGSRVNLERAMRVDGRLDGHIVQGHVDGVGRVRELRRQGDDVQLYVDCDENLANLLVDKGSITIDGVSLTVVEAEAAGFHVVLIPHTLEVTTLGGLAPGDPLNLEADILGKYVQRYLSRIQASTAAASGERAEN
jgi:riboflavin synthase